MVVSNLEFIVSTEVDRRIRVAIVSLCERRSWFCLILFRQGNLWREIAVAEDERFLNTKVNWTFLAISNELDDYAEDEANQRNKPKGLIHDSAQHNITVWAKTWSEVIANARAKLQFINQHLQYEVTQESSQKYLKEAHEKFIPKI